MNDDDRLRRSFEALRRHDERRTPPFQRSATPSRATERGRARILFVAGPAAGLALAAAAMLWITTTRNAAAPSYATGAPRRPPATVEAEAPLDFLLDAPRSSVLSNDPGLEAGVLPKVRP